jgi:hypothetical protein
LSHLSYTWVIFTFGPWLLSSKYLWLVSSSIYWEELIKINVSLSLSSWIGNHDIANFNSIHDVLFTKEKILIQQYCPGIFSSRRCYMFTAVFSVNTLWIQWHRRKFSIDSSVTSSNIRWLYVTSYILQVSTSVRYCAIVWYIRFLVKLLVYDFRFCMVYSFVKEEILQISIWPVCMDTYDTYYCVYAICIHGG